VSRDDEHAQRLLEDALQVWRGEPFGVLDTDWLNGQRESLKARASRRGVGLHQICGCDAGSTHRWSPNSSPAKKKAGCNPFDERLSRPADARPIPVAGGSATRSPITSRPAGASSTSSASSPARRCADCTRQILHADPPWHPPDPTSPGRRAVTDWRADVVRIPRGPVPHQLPAPPRGLSGAATNSPNSPTRSGPALTLAARW